MHPADDGGCGVIRTVQTSDKYENELIFSGTHSSARVDEQSPTADIVIQPFLGELRARFRDRSSPLRPTSLAVHDTPVPQVGRHYYRVGSSHVKHDRLKEVGKFLQNHLLTSANTNSLTLLPFLAWERHGRAASGERGGGTALSLRAEGGNLQAQPKELEQRSGQARDETDAQIRAAIFSANLS